MIFPTVTAMNYFVLIILLNKMREKSLGRVDETYD